MVVALLGLASISAHVGTGIERSRQFRHRTVFQLLLFLVGAALMTSAILIAGRPNAKLANHLRIWKLLKESGRSMNECGIAV